MSQTIDRQAQPMAGEWVRVASLAELRAEGRLTVLAKHNVVALFESNGQVYAVDNRCPHMGFPPGQRQRQRLHPDLPLASCPLRPGERRHVRPLGRRCTQLPGQDCTG